MKDSSSPVTPVTGHGALTLIVQGGKSDSPKAASQQRAHSHAV